MYEKDGEEGGGGGNSTRDAAAIERRRMSTEVVTEKAKTRGKYFEFSYGPIDLMTNSTPEEGHTYSADWYIRWQK